MSSRGLKQRIAVLGTFALVDANAHARGIDVADFKGAQFGHAQPGAIGGHQQRPVLRMARRLDQARHLLARENLRQFLRCAGARNLELGFGVLERGVVAELKRADRDVATAPGKLPLLDQVQQVALYFFCADLIGTAVVVLRHRRHCGNIGLACARRHATQHHVGFHPGT